MILFDTNVIIDARDESSPWHDWAIERIGEAVSGEGAVVNSVVLAEAMVKVADRTKVEEALRSFGFSVVPLPTSAALPAAAAYASYLRRLQEQGRPERSKIPLGDFFIGAHAQAEIWKVTTRDPRRIRTYFPSVELITPPESLPAPSLPAS